MPLPYEPIEADPVINVPAPTVPSADLPVEQFPNLSRIVVTDLVGPAAANRQHKGLDKRTQSLQQAIARVSAVLAAIDTVYLRADGSTQKDAVAGARGNIPMNGQKFTGLANGSDPQDSATTAQVSAEAAARSGADVALQASVDLKAPINSPTFTGTPTAPKPVNNENSTRIATTDWVWDRILGVSSIDTWDDDFVPLDSWVNFGAAAGYNVVRTFDVPIRNVDGRMLSVLSVESYSTGALDWDTTNVRAGFNFSLRDTVGPVTGGSASGNVTPPAGLLRSLGLSGSATGFGVADTEYPLVPGTADITTGTFPSPEGRAVLRLTALRRSLAVLAPGQLFLRVSYWTNGSFHNHPGGAIRATY